MGSRIVTLLLVVAVGIVGWAVYANVFSDDSEVRKLAEARARANAGCGEKCVVKKMEGNRGLLNEQIQFEFADGLKVLVECKREYIAFGAYTCR